MISNAYFIRDELGVELPEDKGIKLILQDGAVWWIPSTPDNRHWQMYLDWKAEDPENNVPQTEP